MSENIFKRVDEDNAIYNQGKRVGYNIGYDKGIKIAIITAIILSAAFTISLLLILTNK